MKLKARSFGTTFVLAATSAVAAIAAESIPVTVDNFVCAESDLYFAGALKEAGGIGGAKRTSLIGWPMSANDP